MKDLVILKTMKQKVKTDVSLIQLQNERKHYDTATQPTAVAPT